MNVSKRNYGNYSSSNYGAHTTFLRVGSLSLWFSYDTLVAFEDGNGEFHIIENCWQQTTGKHLNWINGDKSIREDKTTFQKHLDEALRRHCLEVQ